MLSATMLYCYAAYAALQQDTVHQEETPRVGLGISLVPYVFPNNDTYPVQPAGVMSWYIPVQIGRYFRWETEFSYAQTGDSLLFNLNNNSVPARHYRVTTYAHLGMGVYYTHPLEEHTRLYGGVRSGIVSASVQWETFLLDRVMTQPFLYAENIGSFWIGGVIGFEYSITRHVAFGAEAHITSYATGAVSSRSPLPADYPARFPAGRTSDVILTSARIALRVFM